MYVQYILCIVLYILYIWPVALTPILTKCFKRLVLANLKAFLTPSPEPFQFAPPLTALSLHLSDLVVTMSLWSQISAVMCCYHNE